MKRYHVWLGTLAALAIAVGCQQAKDETESMADAAAQQAAELGEQAADAADATGEAVGDAADATEEAVE